MSIQEPKCYFDEQTGVLMAVFRDGAGEFVKKQFFFSRVVEVDDLTEAITRLEDCAFPTERSIST